jgi:hypothetical protein
MGRKRKPGRREPNGRVQRSHEAANLEPFKERMRRYGLNEKDARDQKSSTVIGRMYLQGHLTEPQYEAGARLATDSAEYARCLQSPRGMGIAETLTGSGDEEAHARHVAKVKRAYEGARDVLKRLQERDGLRGTTIFDAVRFIVEQDLELPHLYPGLRLGLLELARYYGTAAAAERKAA